MIKCCIFDLDGTLLYTLDSITLHLNNTLKQFGISPITVEQCRIFIGKGARNLVTSAVRANGDYPDDVVESVLCVYNEAYNSEPVPFTYTYPGIGELVDELYKKGVHLAVVTNKPQNTARQLISHFFPNRFSIVVGGRAGAVLKPDPRDSLDVIQQLSVSNDETAFIGDTSLDIKTAKNMNAAISVGVLWGYRDEKDLGDAGADFIVKSAHELLEVLVNYDK